MSTGTEHDVVIQRRGRSHRARCACGWTGHAWNELRPAEADAWHHVFGDERVVDMSALGDRADSPLTTHPVSSQRARPGPAVESVVHRACALADSPYPYGKRAVSELWHLAEKDRALLQAATAEIGARLRRHSQLSAGTADSEWLQLITAKRLVEETLAYEDTSSYL